jgi:hypothetical protein
VSGTTVTIAGSLADVAPAPAGTFTPTGSVKIMSGSKVLATAALTAGGSFNKALALASGTYTVTVLYVPGTNAQGQTNFSSDSITLTFTI